MYLDFKFFFVITIIFLNPPLHHRGADLFHFPWRSNKTAGIGAKARAHLNEQTATKTKQKKKLFVLLLGLEYEIHDGVQLCVLDNGALSNLWVLQMLEGLKLQMWAGKIPAQLLGSQSCTHTNPAGHSSFSHRRWIFIHPKFHIWRENPAPTPKFLCRTHRVSNKSGADE